MKCSILIIIVKCYSSFLYQLSEISSLPNIALLIHVPNKGILMLLHKTPIVLHLLQVVMYLFLLVLWFIVECIDSRSRCDAVSCQSIIVIIVALHSPSIQMLRVCIPTTSAAVAGTFYQILMLLMLML